mgnify:CR=1 FL=1
MAGGGPLHYTSSTTTNVTFTNCTAGTFSGGTGFTWPVHPADTNPARVITADYIWRQHKVFWRMPSKCFDWLLYTAWFVMGVNGALTLLCCLVWDTDNPTNKIYLSILAPVLFIGLLAYKWRKMSKLTKAARVMNVLESVAGGE